MSAKQIEAAKAAVADIDTSKLDDRDIAGINKINYELDLLKEKFPAKKDRKDPPFNSDRQDFG